MNDGDDLRQRMFDHIWRMALRFLRRRGGILLLKNLTWRKSLKDACEALLKVWESRPGPHDKIPSDLLKILEEVVASETVERHQLKVGRRVLEVEQAVLLDPELSGKDRWLITPEEILAAWRRAKKNPDLKLHKATISALIAKFGSQSLSELSNHGESPVDHSTAAPESADHIDIVSVSKVVDAVFASDDIFPPSVNRDRFRKLFQLMKTGIPDYEIAAELDLHPSNIPRMVIAASCLSVMIYSICVSWLPNETIAALLNDAVASRGKSPETRELSHCLPGLLIKNDGRYLNDFPFSTANVHSIKTLWPHDDEELPV